MDIAQQLRRIGRWAGLAAVVAILACAAGAVGAAGLGQTVTQIAFPGEIVPSWEPPAGQHNYVVRPENIRSVTGATQTLADDVGLGNRTVRVELGPDELAVIHDTPVVVVERIEGHAIIPVDMVITKTGPGLFTTFTPSSTWASVFWAGFMVEKEEPDPGTERLLVSVLSLRGYLDDTPLPVWATTRYWWGDIPAGSSLILSAEDNLPGGDSSFRMTVDIVYRVLPVPAQVVE